MEPTKPKLLICTPAYGGMVTSQYMQSLVNSTCSLINDGINFGYFNIENESLISRARNRCAMYALDHGYERLLFIDADMIWTYADLKKILDSKHEVVGGTYPVKGFPISINYNPLRDNPFFSLDRGNENFNAFAEEYTNEDGEAEVLHIPTGFMAIDCSVFKKLAYEKKVTPYEYPDMQLGRIVKSYDFFPVRVVDGEYESEDWAFCALAREVGYKIYLNTKVVNGHTGTWHYRA